MRTYKAYISTLGQLTLYFDDPIHYFEDAWDIKVSSNRYPFINGIHRVLTARYFTSTGEILNAVMVTTYGTIGGGNHRVFTQAEAAILNKNWNGMFNGYPQDTNQISVTVVDSSGNEVEELSVQDMMDNIAGQGVTIVTGLNKQPKQPAKSGFDFTDWRFIAATLLVGFILLQYLQTSAAK